MSGHEPRAWSKEPAPTLPCVIDSVAVSTSSVVPAKRGGDSAFAPLNTTAFHFLPFTFSPHRRDAFSLIEVVLAIGVVAFSLLGIVGLFSSSIKNNRESSAQQEAFHAARVISSSMQETNFFHPPNSLGTLQLALCPRGATTNYYLYASDVYNSGGTLVLTNERPKGMTDGTLYCVQVQLSENLISLTNTFPFGDGRTNATYTDWTNWPGLPLSVRVYTLPNGAPTNSITNTVPVMTFDMVIPR
jgi:type II secretory pathway pseudopilin PulG